MRRWVLAFASLLLSGCSLLEPVPAYQMDLSGTTWTFVEIDGRQVTGTASVTFSDGQKAVVETACRATDTEYALDTDGAAIGFGNVEPTPVSCSGEAAKQDQDVANALVRSIEWRVVDSNHIELLGVREGTVARLARADLAP